MSHTDPGPPGPNQPAALQFWPLWPSLLLALLVLLAWRGTPGPDLVVYGGTPQGVMAAVAASRQGLHVLLLEPGPQLGGVVVRSWLATLDDTQDAQHHSLYGGLYAEFYRRTGSNRNVDIGQAEQVLWRMLRGAHVDVRLNTTLESGPGAVRLEDGQIRSITVRHLLGVRRFAAQDFIDATDTASLAAQSGASFTLGRQDGGLDRKQMAATLVLKIGGVDWFSLEQALTREQRTYHDLEGFDRRGAYGFGTLVSGYKTSQPRVHLRGLNIARQDDGSLLVNALLIAGVDGTSETGVRQAYRLAAREAQHVTAFLRRADDKTFGHAQLLGVAPELYLRETRHLLGQQRLHADEALLGEAGLDSVATGGYPLDGQIYDPKETPFLLGQPAPYGIPYGTLVPKGLSNILVVSQAASFDSAAAFSARVVPLQMTLGEVAGTACGLAKRLGLPLASLSRRLDRLQTLRATLTAQGVRVPPVRSNARSQDFTDAHNASHLRGLTLPNVQPDSLVRLLRRGVMGAPYYFKGQLGHEQPMMAIEFLSVLDHWLAAKSTDPAQQRTMRDLLAWASSRQNQALSWSTGRVIFRALHEDDWEFQNLPRPLRRRDAARLVTDMFPAADRQIPLLPATPEQKPLPEPRPENDGFTRPVSSMLPVQRSLLNWQRLKCPGVCPA